MLGISNLHYQGAKGHIYTTRTWRKYAGNPLTDGENTIYNIHLTLITYLNKKKLKFNKAVPQTEARDFFFGDRN
jgi:hypothetical protein